MDFAWVHIVVIIPLHLARPLSIFKVLSLTYVTPSELAECANKIDSRCRKFTFNAKVTKLHSAHVLLSNAYVAVKCFGTSKHSETNIHGGKEIASVDPSPNSMALWVCNTPILHLEFYIVHVTSSHEKNNTNFDNSFSGAKTYVLRFPIVR